MTHEDMEVAITNIINRLEKLESFKKETLKDINGLDDTIEKLEDFRFKAIDDINDIFDDLNVIENMLEMHTDD